MTINLTNSIKDFNDFKDACNYFGIDVNNNQLNLFKKYYEILLDWNKKINLISRKETNILEKHFLDSILFLPEIECVIARRLEEPTKQSHNRQDECEIASPSARNDNIQVLDIGSGGGFPAIPLSIMKPDWKFTLCESIKKKVDFLEHLIKELELNNAEIINTRVEAIHAAFGPLRPRSEASEPRLRRELPQRYDLVTARAVGKLDELIKYALPLLKKDGYLIAYKSKNIDDEIKSAEKLVEKNKLTVKIYSKTINSVERKLIILGYKR